MVDWPFPIFNPLGCVHGIFNKYHVTNVTDTIGNIRVSDLFVVHKIYTICFILEQLMEEDFLFFILKIIWEGLFYFLDLEKYLIFNENENRGN